MDTSKLFEEENLLPISALQHLLFCERQWGLIHLEQIWIDNQLTMEGNYLHKNVDTPDQEQRGSIKIVRSLRLRSLQYGLTGIADVVEFHHQRDGETIPYPIEYKRGKPKQDEIDIVQLCAQILCLEEMLNISITKGAFYYNEPKRRLEIKRLHELTVKQKTPPPHYNEKCHQCSLYNQCMPEAINDKNSTIAYVKRTMTSLFSDEETL
jgi:CRISPR-associated exonuclease Cas4